MAKDNETIKKGIRQMASSMDEQVLRAAKEIIVKFIEVGRVSPASFGEAFRNVYNSIDSAVKGEDKEGHETK